MVPVLFRIGDVPIYSHRFFLLLGLLVGIGVLLLEARRRLWPKAEVVPITMAAFVGGMIGARLSLLFKDMCFVFGKVERPSSATP